MDLRQQAVILDSETVRLTRMQYRLLALLVEHPGKVVPRATLSLHVAGDARGTSPRHVDYHIRGMRRKLGIYADEYIETVIGVGYRFRQRFRPGVKVRGGEKAPAPPARVGVRSVEREPKIRKQPVFQFGVRHLRPGPLPASIIDHGTSFSTRTVAARG